MKRGIAIAPMVLLLAGCINPTKPEVTAIDADLPFNQAMAAVIKQDEFLKEKLRPGFHRADDGAVESYTVDPLEEGGIAVDHVAMLTRQWCAQNGGRIKGFPEIPVLQRGIGYVVQQRDNAPVVGNASNLICFKGTEALAAAAIGRNTYFLSAAQFRQAKREAGASIVDLSP